MFNRMHLEEILLLCIEMLVTFAGACRKLLNKIDFAAFILKIKIPLSCDNDDMTR